MKNRAVALLAVLFGLSSLAMPDTAHGCTMVWDEHEAYRTSDTVVWATVQPSAESGNGILNVSRRLKGSKLMAIPIRWDANWVNDGASCDPWQPIPNYPRGRFFLTDNRDGTFSVRAQTPIKKAQR